MRGTWLVLAGLSLLAACDSPGSEATVPAETPPATTAPATTAPPPVPPGDRFAACMSAEGVAIDELPTDAAGRLRFELAYLSLDLQSHEVLEALAECSPILEAGALELGSNAELREMVISSLQGFAECVRSEGVPDFPDPDPGFNGVGPPFPPADIPHSDPRLDAAVEACRTELAAG